jgi:AcrR family transcriptional regulator
MATEVPERRRRSDGVRSRELILDAAARLATVEGLNGLSIGRLAEHIGMSKSGLFAHFGSKEELQLATIDAAATVFQADVVAPAMELESPRARVEALCERFLAHVEHEVFPGGCFFASTGAELDTRPGPVRDRVVAVIEDWIGLMHTAVTEAQAAGELSADADPAQLTFEVEAMLAQANAVYVLQGDRRAFELARRAIQDRLGRE